jgi:endonuclease/exonuclease/phosphatase (EEP) superfamily protein YafD
VVLLLALVGIVVTCIPAASGDTWWIRFLDFPRLEFLVALLVIGALLILMLLALRVRDWLGLLALALVAAAAAYNAYILFPYSPLAAPQQVLAKTCREGNQLRLLEVNVQMTNRHDHRLLNIVRQAEPDIAWFQETDDWWVKELSALTDHMPHHIGHAQPNYFGVDLYSRLPLVDPQIMHLTRAADPSVFTGMRLPLGQVVKLYALHPRPPQQGQSTATRDGQLMATALAARDDTEPHVVAGDMNSVPWEEVIHRTQRVGRFLGPRIGRGLYITWDAGNPVMRWPLDQILPGPDFTLLSLRVLPAFGSDHLPYLAELCLDPSAAPRQPPPALQQDDIGAAQAAVWKGQ